MHLTLFFIGETDRIEAVKEALAGVNTVSFELVMRGVGRFPAGDRKPARVLWVGLEHQPVLLSLQQEVSTVLVKQGFAAEKHPYSPHITLARLERSSPEIERFLETYHDFHVPSFTVKQFVLVSSVLTHRARGIHTSRSIHLLENKRGAT